MEAEGEPDRAGRRRRRRRRKEGGERGEPRKEPSEEKRADGLALRAEEVRVEAMAIAKKMKRE